jgi:fluoroquinolone transport system permease protein
MTRLVSALRLELTLQVRQKFLHAAIFSGHIWLAVLLPMPARLRPIAEPYVLVGDVAIIGFFFVGGTVFFEKQERTIGAIISTPLRFWPDFRSWWARESGNAWFDLRKRGMSGFGSCYYTTRCW